jgi:calcium/calmodulin-dependent protein kinase (CaM kinase) II/calcium/calmodulin-dependent protein kinase I
VLFQRIREGDYEFHPEHWSPVSHDAKDFIKRLLNVNPRKRMTAIQALNHKWMTTSGDLLADKDLGNSLFELKRFNAKRKFKAAVKTIIATQKLSSLFS